MAQLQDPSNTKPICDQHYYPQAERHQAALTLSTISESPTSSESDTISVSYQSHTYTNVA